MKQITLTFYSDPGHGWLASPRPLITRYNLEISACSYQKGNMVYLEEDLDAPKLIEALNNDKTVQLRIVDKHTDRQSRIRSYLPYNAINIHFNKH